ncbi:WD repeat-containing protein 43 [Zootermopsis nevadensis]|uniref:WD repeat-containing protein 43 n=1 Tax=Zootermopsis nevadensis TaxID=136037 RepID=A0A067R5B4_ZOONE|nr:WD repeat-containing protein 43 [Zootermopsis nevadensis]KDR13291.1 WD repeat-containing protein 43 [Zootermopsis nevadensis]
MAVLECSAFSESGKYFGYCGVDGKLKVWETESGILSQEYTPNLHLSSPCTCLTWVASRNSVSPRKRKKRKSDEHGSETDTLALGTVSGNLLLYSVTSGSMVSQLDSGHSSAVNHVAWSRGSNLFSCDDRHIVEWNVADCSVKSKWKAGSERVTCLLVLPDSNSLLVAGCTIGLWDIPSKKLMRRYTGHASEVTSLTLVPGTESYFISAAKNDRLLSAWSLSLRSQDKNAVASFAMEDVATSVSLCSTDTTSVVAVTSSGVLHVYRHQLNGKCSKPLKPKVTVQIATDTGQSKDAVQRIPILGAMKLGSGIIIAHGSPVFLSFETICPKEHEKVVCLVRQDPRKKSTSRDGVVSKVKIPEASDSVEYVSQTATVVTPVKRGKKLKSDVPMEERLENLSLTRQEAGGHEPPRTDSMAHLLMQGLCSKDRKILQSVLMKNDPALISSTVMRLSLQCTIPLLKELVTLIQGKTIASQIAVLWLKAVIKSHAGQLMANSDVRDTLSPVLGLVETRLGLLAPLSRLRGRLDLLVDQMGESNKGNVTGDLGESLLVFQDQDSEEGSGIEDTALGSESEDHWEELSDMNMEEEAEAEGETEELDMSS